MDQKFDRKGLIMRVLFFVVALLLSSASTTTHAMGQMAPGPSQLNGNKAPDFTLPMTDGSTKTFSQVSKGKKTVLFFWATWCPHCHEELSRISDSLADIRRQEAEVVLVDVGEGTNHVKAFLKFNRIDLESFIDADSSLQDIYQLVGVPTIYFIDQAGTVRGQSHTFPGDFDRLYFNDQDGR
jgi:peroxiredoxin